MNVTCAEIQITDGFEFRVPADRFTHFHQSDCEQLWYSQVRECFCPQTTPSFTINDCPNNALFDQDDRLIADPSDPQKLIDPVISFSSDRLVTSHCVNELHHETRCDTSRVNYFSLNICDPAAQKQS